MEVEDFEYVVELERRNRRGMYWSPVATFFDKSDAVQFTRESYVNVDRRVSRKNAGVIENFKAEEGLFP